MSNSLARHNALEFHTLRLALRDRARALGLTPEDMDRLLGWLRGTANVFESYETDPTLWQLKLYAMLVGARLKLEVTFDD